MNGIVFVGKDNRIEEPNEASILINNLVQQARDAERQRGDTYRRRALVLIERLGSSRHANRVYQGEIRRKYAELADAREHASISLARSASDGLAKEAAESALEATKRAIVRDLWPHLDFQYPQITFAIQRAGETIAAAQAEAAMLAVLLTRWVEWMNDERWVTKGSAYPHLLPDTVAALAARDPQEKR